MFHAPIPCFVQRLAELSTCDTTDTFNLCILVCCLLIISVLTCLIHDNLVLYSLLVLKLSVWPGCISPCMWISNFV